MITTLITFICILIALALFAGAFYLAKYVISLQHRVNVLEDTYTAAEQHIQKQEEVIAQLTQQIDMMERENVLASKRVDKPRAWKPRDIMNVGERGEG
jgi:predicted PurR-regulated permease PerM